MAKLKKVVALVVAMTMVMMSLSGCGGNNTDTKTSEEDTTNVETDSSSVEYKDEIHIAINAAPSTLDLTATSVDVARIIANGNVFEGLVNQKGDYTGDLELAESLETNEDYTEYVYKLRKGVMFHNGQEMKADDVVASMNRWIDTYGNAKQTVGESYFEKVDDYTVKISLEVGTMYLNDIMASCGQMAAIMPASVIEDVDPETGFVKEYIGTGPYMVDEWVADQYIKLVKFDDYTPYGNPGDIDVRVGYKEAKTPVVYYDFVTDDATRVAGIQTGEYDFAYKLPSDNYSMFEDKTTYTIYSELAGSLGLIYNKKEGISSNAAFRKAINAALNDEDIMRAAYAEPEFYVLDSSYMAKSQTEWYSLEGDGQYNIHDGDLVRTYLEEAGYNGETFTLLVSSDYTEFYNAAIVIEEELKDYGINCELKVCDWATFLEYRADPSAFDAFITSWAPVALPTLFNWMTTTYPGWLDDEKLLEYEDTINTGVDSDAVKKLWVEEVQKYCWEEALPISKFGDFNMYSVSSTKVKDVVYFMGALAYNMTVEK